MTPMERRRALMAVKKGGGGIPAGYVTDGLVFFLDGKQLVSANSWTDIVSGKTFALTDCAVSGNGVMFDGSTSVGVYDGVITRDWASETIEVAITGSTSSGSRSILGQPFVDGAVGISMLLGADNIGFRVPTLAIDNVTRNYKRANSNAKIISANKDRVVSDLINRTNTNQATPGKNESGKTTLGHRIIGQSISSYFAGTIYAVRIYNRILTEAEMLQNQQADIDRYGITI